MDYQVVLKDLRLKAGFTQQEIADHLSIDRAHVSHIEAGRRMPSIEALEKWVSTCGGTLEIRGRDGQMSVPQIAPLDAKLLASTQQLTEADQQWLVELAGLVLRASGQPKETAKGMAQYAFEQAVGQSSPVPTYEIPEVSPKPQRGEKSKDHRSMIPAERSGRTGAAQKKG